MSADSSSNEARATGDRGPWWWIPSLYFAEGVPYVVVMTVAVIMFKRLGVGNAEIALYTSWLYLPYAIKPLWSPLVQRIGIACQLHRATAVPLKQGRYVVPR